MQLAPLVLIHDTRRSGEQKTIKKLLGDWERLDLRSERGLALFINPQEGKKHL